MINMSTYYKFRPDIKNGDMAAFKGKGLFSKAIKWWTKSDYSHVAMFIWLEIGGEDRLMIAHAVYPTGVVFMWASQYFSRYKGDIDLYFADHIRLRQEVPVYQRKLAKFMGEQSGRGYDDSGVKGFVLKFFKQRASNYYCSELVASAWEELKQASTSDLSPGAIAMHPIYLSHIQLI